MLRAIQEKALPVAAVLPLLIAHTTRRHQPPIVYARAMRGTMKFNMPSVPVEFWPFHATSFRRFARAAVAVRLGFLISMLTVKLGAGISSVARNGH